MQRGAPCCGLEPEETCLRARWEGCLAFLRAGFYFRDLGTIRSCFHVAKNQQCVSVSLGAGGACASSAGHGCMRSKHRQPKPPRATLLFLASYIHLQLFFQYRKILRFL